MLRNLLKVTQQRVRYGGDLKPCLNNPTILVYFPLSDCDLNLKVNIL